MAPMEFDEAAFAQALQSLYFERSREKAEEMERVLIAQVQILVEQAARRERAYMDLSGSRGMIRLAKLTESGDAVTPEGILDGAADLIEALEKQVSSYGALAKYEDELKEAAG